ncbi:hypothetical protein BDQ17DRAFT_1352247 [Cyathus striatus]|nr:hypothetical protein BDQ17DRAFT_1352247 [Cyathus striatus]
MNARYIDRKEAEATYRPKSGIQKRANWPCPGAFAVGVWAYSISAVKQDVFDDVDEEAKALQAAGAGPAQKAAHALVDAVKEEKQIVEGAVAAIEGKPLQTDKPFSAIGLPARGHLQRLDKHYPWLLDPVRKTWVWGAPPVDNIGKMGGKS